MRMLATMSLAAMLSTAASLSSFSQPASPPARAPGSESTESEQDLQASTAAKRRACRQDGTSKSMSGPDLQDYVAVCVLEARLACLKQAVAQKVRPPQRRDFIGKCMGS
jgi:hypothetical protein